MSWLTGLSQTTILWIALVAFLSGLATGGGTAWTVQGYRLKAVQSEYNGFVSTTKAQGESAKKEAARQKAIDQSNKEQADHENQTTIASLRADIKRLRDARSGGGFVPAATAGASRPDLACFDRSELESALRDLDRGVQGLVDEGSETTVNLDTAKKWANLQRPQ